MGVCFGIYCRTLIAELSYRKATVIFGVLGIFLIIDIDKITRNQGRLFHCAKKQIGYNRKGIVDELMRKFG